jgi:hypothetical protein
MTRKDYIRLAKALSETRPNERSHAEYDTWLSIRFRLMQELRDDNPRFDWDRFTAATE